MRLKTPPQAVEIEEAVLGAMLIDSRGIEEVMEFLRPSVFYNSANRKIFEAIQALYGKEAIDLMTVAEELRKSKSLEDVGGEYYLVNLTQKISSSAHIEFHGRILLQKYIQRELIANSSAIIEKAYDDGQDSLELLDKAYNHLGNVSDLIIQNTEVDLKALTAKIVEHGAKLFRNEIKPGIDTPIENLTRKMGGWRNGELIILAARPGMGKTAFALKSGWITALAGIPVVFFSLEMSSEQLLSRLWSQDLRIDNDKFTKDGLSPEEEKMVLDRMNSLEKIPFHIDDTSSLTLQSLTVKAKKMKKKHGIKLIILDYLQLMTGNSKKNREGQISEISRGLKLLAKELNVPVIALSQLSRAVETRGGSKRPLLSDLRESGAIEQDADVVQFIYRPEYYHIDEWDSDYNNQPCKGEAEYIIAKNRNGQLVRNRMRFEARYTLFSDLDDFDESFGNGPVAPNNENPWKGEIGKPVQVEEDDDLPF